MKSKLFFPKSYVLRLWLGRITKNQYRLHMLRRHFLKSLGLLTNSFALPNVTYSLTNIFQFKTLQISSIAGFQYYQGEKIWQQLAIGQPLQQIREADNKYDDHAVIVEWRGQSSAISRA